MSVLKTFYGVRHVKENWNGAKLYDKVFFPASIWRGFSKCNLAFRKMNWKILRKSHKNSIKSGISESTVEYCGWSFDFGFCVKCIASSIDMSWAALEIFQTWKIETLVWLVPFCYKIPTEFRKFFYWVPIISDFSPFFYPWVWFWKVGDVRSLNIFLEDKIIAL